MLKLAYALALAGVVMISASLLSVGGIKASNQVSVEEMSKKQTVVVEKSTGLTDLNNQQTQLNTSTNDLKVITLEARNTVLLRSVVTDDSMTKLQRQIKDMDNLLPAGVPIYLVLDSPGGSIIAGLDFIDFAMGIGRPIHTVTLFSASMAFQIVQNLNDRNITPQGLLMSHRAAGGIEGQFDGELESQYMMIKRKIDYLDSVAAKRMGKTLKEYKASIVNEYWVSGFDAVGDKAADAQILVKCGKSMVGTEEMQFETMFGSVDVTFDKCPLMRAPLAVKFGKDNENPEDDELEEQTREATKLLFSDKNEFFKKYIKTGKYEKMYK